MIQRNMLPGAFASTPDGRTQTTMTRYAAGAVAAVAIALLVWHPWAAPVAEQPEPESAEVQEEQRAPSTLEGALAAHPAYENPSPSDFSAIEAADAQTTAGFTLTEGDAPALSSERAAALDEALAYYTDEEVPVGFLLMDIGSGRGFAHNIDQEIYGASTFKALYCAYLLIDQVENGEFSLTSAVRDGVMSQSGSFRFSGQDTLENMISDSIIYSDNNSYGALRASFSDADLARWLESVSADSGMAYDEWFPHCSARDAARLWSTAYTYMQTGTEGAQLLSELCASTKTSFMRDALTNEEALLVETDAAPEGQEAVTDAAQEGGAEAGDTASTPAPEGAGEGEAPSEGETASEEAASEEELTVSSAAGVGAISACVATTGATMQERMTEPMLVRSKAGWYPGDTEDISCVSENGIVTLNGRDCLICVMTGARYTDRNVLRMEELTRAVFALHDDLA